MPAIHGKHANRLKTVKI